MKATNKVQWGMLQRTNATTNECYNERMLQRTVSMNKIRMLQRTRMLYNERVGLLSADVARA